MHDPIAAGRRSALRAAAVQAVVALLVALIFLAQGPQAALAAGIGGGALALGNALAAGVSLGGIVPARVAFARLLLGALLKWTIAIVVLVIALGVWRLPPFPMVVGLAAATLAYLVALNLRQTTKRIRT